MSRTYEMMFILRPDLSDEAVTQQMRKYYDLLKEYGAEKVAMKVWGKRHLAYPIKKFQDGIYILVNFTGDGSQIAPVERAMRLSEEVIRYLTTKLRKDIEVEDKQFTEIQSAEVKPVASPTTEAAVESQPPEEQETTEAEPVAVS